MSEATKMYEILAISSQNNNKEHTFCDRQAAKFYESGAEASPKEKHLTLGPPVKHNLHP